MIETREDFAAWIEDRDAPAPDLDRDPTPPQNPAEAAAYLRKIERLDAEAAEVKEFYAAEVSMLDAWKADRLAAVERARTWLETALEGWFRARRRDGGTKTLRLPHGTLKLTAPSSRRSVVFDPGDTPVHEALAAVLTVDHRLVRVKLELDRKAVADLCEPGPDDQAMLGDVIVPHVGFQPKAERDTFRVVTS